MGWAGAASTGGGKHDFAIGVENFHLEAKTDFVILHIRGSFRVYARDDVDEA
jgi:hypothetical protein